MSGVWHEGASIASIIVVWDDYVNSVSGIAWKDGEDGVTLIEATHKNGEFCSIPYVRVWQGDKVIAEYSQHVLREVRFK